MFVNIEKLVLETCVNMLKFNDEFRKGIVNSIKKFYESAENRTAD